MCSVTQSCLTLCNPKDSSLPGSSVCGIGQARILEWVAVSNSTGFSQSRDRTHVSFVFCIGWWSLYRCTTWEALKGSTTVSQLDVVGPGFGLCVTFAGLASPGMRKCFTGGRPPLIFQWGGSCVDLPEALIWGSHNEERGWVDQEWKLHACPWWEKFRTAPLCAHCFAKLIRKYLLSTDNTHKLAVWGSGHILLAHGNRQTS